MSAVHMHACASLHARPSVRRITALMHDLFFQFFTHFRDRFRGMAWVAKRLQVAIVKE